MLVMESNFKNCILIFIISELGYKLNEIEMKTNIWKRYLYNLEFAINDTPLESYTYIYTSLHDHKVIYLTPVTR